MTTMTDYAAATAGLNNLVADMEGFATAADVAIAAALAAIIAPDKVIYLDTAGGSDANSGLDSGHAIRTIAHAVTLQNAGQRLWIKLLGNLVIPALVSFSEDIFIEGSGGQRTVTFNPAAEGITNSPYKAVWYMDHSNRVLQFGNCDIVVGALDSDAVSAINMNGGVFGFANGSIAINGSSVAPLLSSGSFLATSFTGATLVSGYAGKLFLGVSSGGNPNSNTLYQSNLTSA